MKIHHITLSIIFVCMIVLASITFINEFGEKYTTTADLSRLNKTTTRLDKQQKQMNETHAAIKEVKLDRVADYFTIPYKLIKVGWKAVKQIFGSWSVVMAIMGDVSTGLADTGIILPAWLIPSIISILLLIIIAICIYAFFKWKFEV